MKAPPSACVQSVIPIHPSPTLFHKNHLKNDNKIMTPQSQLPTTSVTSVSICYINDY